MPARHLIDNSQRGAVLPLALLMLALLTLIVMAGAATTTIEVQISGNQQNSTAAFYRAEGGTTAGALLVSETVDRAAAPPYSSVSYLGEGAALQEGGTDFRDEVSGYRPLDAGTDDLLLETESALARIDLTGRRTVLMPGSGIEFASGSAGLGAGSAGGVSVLYNIAALGEGPGGARARIEIAYRKVLGTTGGL